MGGPQQFILDRGMHIANYLLSKWFMPRDNAIHFKYSSRTVLKIMTSLGTELYKRSYRSTGYDCAGFMSLFHMHSI